MLLFFDIYNASHFANHYGCMVLQKPTAWLVWSIIYAAIYYY
jgi:hypothetical protein